MAYRLAKEKALSTCLAAGLPVTTRTACIRGSVGCGKKDLPGNYLLQESFCSRRGHLKGDDGSVQPLIAKKTDNFFWENAELFG
jgi:hypothetical protein